MSGADEHDPENEIADGLETAASADAGRPLRWYAAAYLSLLFGGSAALVVAAVLAGYLTPDIAIRATVNIGWLVEHALIALGALFILFTASMVLVLLPGQLVAGLARAAARAADAYQLPESTSEPDSESTSEER